MYFNKRDRAVKSHGRYSEASENEVTFYTGNLTVASVLPSLI